MAQIDMAEAVYGAPPPALAAVGPGAVQTSPLIVGASPIEDLPDGALGRFTVLAPPGALERRYVLAHALRALKGGGELIALAPKGAGGARLGHELAGFGCVVGESARRHHRICRCPRPASPAGLAQAIAAGGLQLIAALGLVSQPGVFAWDRIDPGTALLLAQPFAFVGAGADFGCGAGLLARAALRSNEITRLHLIDLDARALAAAARNIDDPRARFVQHDLRRPPLGLSGLDFVLMNPPFHLGGAEDRALGAAFVASARAVLRPGGGVRLVANVALPYERALAAHFSAWRETARAGGYKVLEAIA